MINAGSLIIKHSKIALENKQKAILYVVVLSLLPFVSWLSIALVSLITLRKGIKTGFEVMLPAIVIHSVPLMFWLSPESAFVNTLVSYIPCFIAALCLRETRSWQAVCGIFLIQAFLGLIAVQLFAPDFALNQFIHFKALLKQHQYYQLVILRATDEAGSYILAHLFLGIQVLSMAVSALCSLLCARWVQARLFNPGGFKQEVREFRGNKVSFAILMIMITASCYGVALAVNILPIALFYFLAAGMNLTLFLFSQKKYAKMFFLLFLFLLLKPFYVLFSLVIIGTLDSLINFRLFLPLRVNKSI